MKWSLSAPVHSRLRVLFVQILQILVISSGHSSCCFLSVVSSQSAHLTLNINKEVSPA